ncbi:protein of unassigned function [Methylobacterium oryzae CBMB20]|uniref:Protein of unassigned function n=1 Tax=Methylobacterium oryzae CBMB20 TaxID=693986 RepID=A0A089NXQ2_9HYPH|nr:protein of unassigned function [Methylobacterium oryzae CBMB20]
MIVSGPCGRSFRVSARSARVAGRPLGERRYRCSQESLIGHWSNKTIGSMAEKKVFGEPRTAAAPALRAGRGRNARPGPFDAPVSNGPVEGR